MTRNSVLPKEVIALVHHIELNRSGWWEKAVQRLVLASVWLSDHPSSAQEISETLKREFHLSIDQGKLTSALRALEKQDILVALQDCHYRIPDAQRSVFEQEIEQAEKVATDAREYFSKLVEKLCAGLEAKNVWSVFESEFLTPLVNEVGANAFHIITGERMATGKNLVDRFLNGFETKYHTKLKELVAAFLDPKREEVRAFVSRMLHARFCVEASALPEPVIQQLCAAIGKPIRFRVFVDTNFLFSLLELHENPSNTAARELQALVGKLNTNPKVQLYIVSKTIREAKSSITSAKYRLSGVPAGNNFTKAALKVGVSGMADRFLSERLRRGGRLTVEDWFDPYDNDLVAIARGKGIEFFNEPMDSYSMRQDVVDDIMSVQKHEERLDENKRKSYEIVAHDVILWHFVNDKRASYIESPIEAQEWILTIDYRFIGFDQYKQKSSGSRVPLCLHPTSLIQILQFWVPRTREFEEAVLDSMRLPFLFREFDIEAERTSLRILKGLGRYENRDDISEQAITNVLLNDALRSRLRSERSEGGDAEAGLIRDALLEEMKARADAAANKAEQLQNTVRNQEASLVAMDAERRASVGEVERLRRELAYDDARIKMAEERLVVQGAEIEHLNAEETGREAKRRHRIAFLRYLGMLGVLLLITGVAFWYADSLFSQWAKVLGPLPIRMLTAVSVFVLGHLLFERQVQGNSEMRQLWPFKQLKRFRKWLLLFVVGTLAFGVLASLWANQIQKNLDQKERGAPFGAILAPNSSESPK